MISRDNIFRRWLRDAFNEYVVKPIGIQLIEMERRLRNTMSDLSTAVQAVADDQKRIAADVQAILALLQQPNPDVAAAVAGLQAVDAALDASAEALEAVVPPATPPVQP